MNPAFPQHADKAESPGAVRRRKLRCQRRTQAMGGFFLLCSFFLPAVRACNSSVVPAEEVMDFFGSSDTTDLTGWFGVFLLYVAAYLYGLLTLIVALRRRKEPSAVESQSSISIAILFGAVVAIISIGILAELRNPTSLDLGGGLFSVAVLISCAYWLRSVRMGAGGMLCLRWYVATCCVVWFGLWFVDGDSMYGLWMSLAGALAIAVGCFLEARLRSRRKTWSTLAQLLTCRLQLFDLDSPHCLKCGYLLYGLPSPRCPECSQPFSPEEAGLEATRQGPCEETQ